MGSKVWASWHLCMPCRACSHACTGGITWAVALPHAEMSQGICVHIDDCVRYRQGLCLGAVVSKALDAAASCCDVCAWAQPASDPHRGGLPRRGHGWSGENGCIAAELKYLHRCNVPVGAYGLVQCGIRLACCSEVINHQSALRAVDQKYCVRVSLSSRCVV